MPSRKLYLRLWHPAKRKRGFLILPDGNVLPSHLHTAASVDLQTDDAICEFGRGVRKVHNLCAIVFSIEESNPAAFMRSLSQGAQPEEERYGKYPTTSFHDKSSASA
ncbi:MAG: hypothetical protein DMG97_06035 [Acidobacteria bacterium]|nr:MAG: hypothetical protein DMG97_06035 [Acidobacteriota bacterium]